MLFVTCRRHSMIRTQSEWDRFVALLSTRSFSSYDASLRLLYCLRRCDLLIQRQDIRLRPKRRDGKWVDLLVALGVVLLDVRKFGRAAEGFVVPVQVSDPSMMSVSLPALKFRRGIDILVQVRVSAPNVADIALEVLDVDCVEANDRCVQSHIRLSQTIAEVVWASGLC